VRFAILLAGFIFSIAAQTQSTAQAQSLYPNKPIKFVVPFPPGGNLDFVARTLQPKMQEVLGQPVLIDNRGGNAGMIGLEYASRQPGDGYTIVLCNTGTIAINQSVYPKMNYDAVKDFVAIGITTTNALMATIAGGVPANNLKEFIAYARANPGKLNFAIAGAGSGPHFGAEMFKRAASLDIPIVFYKGSGPAVTDLLGNQVQIQMDAPSVTMPYVKAGKLKALAVTGKTRLASLPEVPTFEQAGLSGVDAGGFQGVLAPAGTPPEAVARLSDALSKALAQPDVKERIAANGLEVATSTPAEFAAFIRSEIAKWGRVAKEANIKVDP
jgi:tripartite-type tricarboxylate transporter receptor subunit TctC